MVWSLVTKKEMDGFGTNPVFRFYREALGKDNIKLAVVEESDPLDFIDVSDIILLRTANKSLIDRIQQKGVKSTSEDFGVYELVNDKIALGEYLKGQGIPVPQQYTLDNLKSGLVYFVKPRFGSDSKGISESSICFSTEWVKRQVEYIESTMHQESIIEEYISGVDCTVACYVNSHNKELSVCAIEVECEETGGIQTRSCKVGFKEYCSPLNAVEGKEIKEISRRVFESLHLKHHARIDFRRNNDGRYYVIDVNLIPGLGPIDHFAKCLLLEKNISYIDAIKAVVDSAS